VRLHQAGQQVHVQVVNLACLGQHFAQVGGAEPGVRSGCRIHSVRGCGCWRQWGIGNRLNFGYLLRAELDVVVLASVQEEPGAALDYGVMVAIHLEAVAQGDALGCPCRRSQRCQNCNRDEKIPAHSQSYFQILASAQALAA
jgi:hypothetical protein